MMRIIEIRPSRKFPGAWAAAEAPGAEPGFATGTPKADAISYALGRFGGALGEIHVYDETGAAIADKVVIEAGGSTVRLAFLGSRRWQRKARK